MAADGRALKRYIEEQAGTTFVECYSGWKARCPLERDSKSESFVVFDSSTAEFYCITCRAEGGFADFKKLWSSFLADKREAAAPSESPEKVLTNSRTRPGDTQALPARNSLKHAASAAAAVPDSPPEALDEVISAPLPEASASSQLEYLRRQNEGLRHQILKYSQMLKDKGLGGDEASLSQDVASVPIDIFNELLERFERMLVYVGELREKERRLQDVGGGDHTDMLSRYERLLVFADELLEESRQQKALEAKTGELDRQVAAILGRLKAVDTSIERIENALRSFDLTKK